MLQWIRDRRSTGLRVLAVGAALSLALVACAGGNDSDESGGGGGETAGPPQQGGEIVAGLEADTDGLNPEENTWALAGLQMAAAVFDPLMAYNADGEIRPYLAESFEPTNDDFTQFELKLRPNIQFHDGTPLDAAAVKRNLDGLLESPLTAPTLAGLNSPEIVDDLTLKLTTERPWATLPVQFANQLGYMAAPSQLDAPDGAPQDPIGTGPFKLESRTIDAETVFVRNDNYWREGLPYLDKITFRIVPDEQARSQAVVTGDIDLTQTERNEEIATFKNASGIDYFIAADDEEESLYLNQDNPNGQLADERVRMAISYAVDREGHNDLLGAGVTEIADSPWGPESKWYPGDNVTHIGYDPDKARELVDEYESETGEQISLRLGTTPNPNNRASVEFVKENLEEVGIDVELTFVEQSEFIVDLITGDYDINLVRQFGDPDPDGDSIWWFSANADGPLPINFVRNRDPEIDRLLQEARETTDFDTRKELYWEVAQRQNDAAVYVRLYHTAWGVAWQDDIKSVIDWQLPDGEEGLPIIRGRYQTSQIWRS